MRTSPFINYFWELSEILLKHNYGRRIERCKWVAPFHNVGIPFPSARIFLIIFCLLNTGKTCGISTHVTVTVTCARPFYLFVCLLCVFGAYKFTKPTSPVIHNNLINIVPRKMARSNRDTCAASNGASFYELRFTIKERFQEMYPDILKLGSKISGAEPVYWTRK